MMLNDLGYQNNFEMIADIVSNLYFYLERKYSKQITDSKTRLLACGILDTLYQLNVEKSISIENLIEIAMIKVRSDGIDELIDFIIELQVLLFSVEEPLMDKKIIIETVNDNKKTITKVVINNSKKDVFSLQTTQSVDNFMYSKNFRPIRKLLKIKNGRFFN